MLRALFTICVGIVIMYVTVYMFIGILALGLLFAGDLE